MLVSTSLVWQDHSARIVAEAIACRNEGHAPDTLAEGAAVAARLGLGYRLRFYEIGGGMEPFTDLVSRKIYLPLLPDEGRVVAILRHELCEIATYEEIAPPFCYVSGRDEHHHVAGIAERLF